MRTSVLTATVLLLVPLCVSAAPTDQTFTRDFSGPSAQRELCEFLLDARGSADSQGRIDFNATVTLRADGVSPMFTAHVSFGSPTALGKISFTGNTEVNDTVLRRGLAIRERDALDISELRRSLERINRLGLFEPLQLGDIRFSPRNDGVTIDLTIPLRQAKRWRWSLSTHLLGTPGLRASLSLRLPNWGRAIVDASTYVVSFSLFGMSRPILLLERPLIAGQALLSGFELSQRLTSQVMLVRYGQTQFRNAISPLLEADRGDTLSVPVSSGGLEAEPLICKPPRTLRWWAQRSVSILLDLALGNS